MSPGPVVGPSWSGTILQALPVLFSSTIWCRSGSKFGPTRSNSLSRIGDVADLGWADE